MISVASSWMFLKVRSRANRPKQLLFHSLRLSPWESTWDRRATLTIVMMLPGERVLIPGHPPDEFGRRPLLPVLWCS